MEPDKLARLVQVLDDQLGHDVTFAVEAGKIAANDKDAAALPEIDLAVLETDLRVPLPAALLTATLAEMAAQIADVARNSVEQAGLIPGDVTKLILVGGSSLMEVVGAALSKTFEHAEVHRGAAMTGIIEGLALASETAFE